MRTVVNRELHLASDDEIRAALRPYGFDPTAEFCEKTRTYTHLLLRWNKRIPLTTVTSSSEILRFHFGESLFGIEAGHIANGRLADFGSGAGFPGVPLAMAIDGIEAILIESNAKKAAFLSELIRELGLGNARAYHGRTESIAADERFDTVTARAVGSYAEMLNWSNVHVRKRVVLWLGIRQVQEVRATREFRWEEPVAIPQTKGRFVIEGVVGKQVD